MTENSNGISSTLPDNNESEERPLSWLNNDNGIVSEIYDVKICCNKLKKSYLKIGSKPSFTDTLLRRNAPDKDTIADDFIFDIEDIAQERLRGEVKYLYGTHLLQRRIYGMATWLLLSSIDKDDDPKTKKYITSTARALFMAGVRNQDMLRGEKANSGWILDLSTKIMKDGATKEVANLIDEYIELPPR